MVRKRVNERGAALVVAILVMLVLSAMGMVAMKAGTDSTWLSGTYRAGTQSSSFSDSVMQLGLMRSGTRAAVVYDMLRRRSSGEVTALGPGQGKGELRRGGFQIFIPDATPSGGEASLAGLLHDGKLLESTDLHGVESAPRMGVQFKYIVRDPLPGPPAPGFGDQYCFTRVTIGSEAVIGRSDDADEEKRRRRLRAMSRHASEAFIGPIECGAQ